MFKTSNVTILVSDMNRAIQFYTDTLGLKLLSNYGGEFAVIESNGLRIGLHPGKKSHDAMRRRKAILTEQFSEIAMQQTDWSVERRDVVSSHLEDRLLELKAEPLRARQMPEDRVETVARTGEGIDDAKS